MENLKSSKIYSLLFFTIVLFYCLFTARYGFENWDTGYIPSFSWRIINGQSVYEDFFYKGPPLTLYFHAFFIKILPEVGQFYYIRISNYLLFALQVFFAVSGFYNFYGQKIKYNKWAIMSIGFIISLLNFSPYPWPTTDGLLFACIAFFTYSKFQKNINFWKIFIIAFFCVLSALTKQSFYFVPMIFTAGIFLLNGFKNALYFCFCCAIFIGLFLFWITTITTFENFLRFVTGETYLKGLAYAGLIDYIKTDPKYYFVYGLVIATIAFLYLKTKRTGFSPFILFKSTSLVLLLLTLILCLTRSFLEASRIAMLSCFFALLSKDIIDYKLQKVRPFVPMIMTLGLAWCCSISMGYSYPILFSTGIILSIIILFEEEIKHVKKPIILSSMMILFCGIAYSYNLKPYREQQFSKLNSNLEEVSPKLKNIITTPENVEKLLDLKNLILKYDSKNYIVAPNIPMTHYLFNTKSVLPADWVINSEINRRPGLFITLASDEKYHVFLEKSFLQQEELMPDKKEDFSLIAAYIYRNFKKIGETKYFIIYNTIATHEKLPEIN